MSPRARNGPAATAAATARVASRSCSWARCMLLGLALVLVCGITGARAGVIPDSTPVVSGERTGGSVFDALPTPPSPARDVERRQAPSSSSSSIASTPSSALPRAPSSAPSAPPPRSPTPMDLQLSYALSQPCLLYLTSLLSSATFTSCLPFSLLLTTSTSFGALLSTSSTTDNYTQLNDLLAYVASPQPSGEQCDAFLLDAAREMGERGRCEADLRARVPSAREAQTGLGNAGVMREAAGLRDPDTGVYCYLQAVSSDRPDDLYVWGIASGINLPASTRPTCSKCSRQLLSHYALSAPDTRTLNTTIVNQAVATVNAACGSDFAEFYATGSAMSASGAAARSGGVGVLLALALSLGTFALGL